VLLSTTQLAFSEIRVHHWKSRDKALVAPLVGGIEDIEGFRSHGNAPHAANARDLLQPRVCASICERLIGPSGEEQHLLLPDGRAPIRRAL
jgi:hypothetical protein